MYVIENIKKKKIARLLRSNAPGILNFPMRDIFVTLRKNEEENERKSAHDDRVRRC